MEDNGGILTCYHVHHCYSYPWNKATLARTNAAIQLQSPLTCQCQRWTNEISKHVACVAGSFAGRWWPAAGPRKLPPSLVPILLAALRLVSAALPLATKPQQNRQLRRQVNMHIRQHQACMQTHTETKTLIQVIELRPGLNVSLYMYRTWYKCAKAIVFANCIRFGTLKFDVWTRPK